MRCALGAFCCLAIAGQIFAQGNAQKPIGPPTLQFVDAKGQFVAFYSHETNGVRFLSDGSPAKVLVFKQNVYATYPSVFESADCTGVPLGASHADTILQQTYAVPYDSRLYYTTGPTVNSQIRSYFDPVSKKCTLTDWALPTRTLSIAFDPSTFVPPFRLVHQ